MSQVYTVRGGIYDADPVPASALVALYWDELQRAGFAVLQNPVVSPRPTQVQTSEEGPIKRIEMHAPPFEPTSQARDMRVSIDQDPGRMAELGRAQLTTYTWNVCGPDDRVASIGTLRDIIRRRRVEGLLRLSPVITTWSDAPVQLAGYPPRPVQPGCEPRKASSSSAGGVGAALGLLGLLGLLGWRASRRRG